MVKKFKSLVLTEDTIFNKTAIAIKIALIFGLLFLVGCNFSLPHSSEERLAICLSKGYTDWSWVSFNPSNYNFYCTGLLPVGVNPALIKDYCVDKMCSNQSWKERSGINAKINN